MKPHEPQPCSGIPFVEYRNVTKSFTLPHGTVDAVKDFSLEIQRGEVLVLMGPSGCGKSTALGMLAGHLSPTCGDVFFCGEKVAGPDQRRTIVFQQDTLWPWCTVEENLLFSLECRQLQRASGLRRLVLEILMLGSFSRGRVLREFSNSEEIEEALAWLPIVGLKEFRDALPKQLSGGMRKRTELARAYAAKPDLLLLDEPFGNLDALLREEMQDVLGALLEQTRRTVLFVTHDSREAVTVADRVVVMTRQPGRVGTIIPVNLPRPRDSAVRRSYEFSKVANDLHDLVASRVEDTMQSGIPC